MKLLKIKENSKLYYPHSWESFLFEEPSECAYAGVVEIAGRHYIFTSSKSILALSDAEEALVINTLIEQYPEVKTLLVEDEMVPWIFAVERKTESYQSYMVTKDAWIIGKERQWKLETEM